MQFILLSTCLLLASSSFAQQTVTDCLDKDGQLFHPWHSWQLGKTECYDKEGEPGTCASENVCRTENKGIVVTVTSPPGTCKRADDLTFKCCKPRANCTAFPALGSGPQRTGSCLLPQHCTNAASMKASAGQCGGSQFAELGCCVEQEPQSRGVQCSARYSAVSRRISNVQYDLEEDIIFTQNRLANFLPYAMTTFEDLRDPKRCVPLGDCSAATYIAFVYHMLIDMTSTSPNDVINEMMQALPEPTVGQLKSKLSESTYGGHITPEAFGEMMKLLWSDKYLNLLQYSSGTCADWIRMSYAVRGRNSPWKCDDRWFKLMKSHYCRPTKLSNLGDCAGGAGVCHITGNTDGVCFEYGLTEMGTYNHECQSRYGKSPAFCCKKPDASETAMTFSNSEYRNLRIAIDPAVNESLDLINSIKATFTKASKMLYEATGYRAVYRSIRIILPQTWSPDLATASRNDEKLSGAEFFVKPDVTRDANGISPLRITMTTLQLGYCGSQGLGTQMTPRDVTGKNAAANIVKHFAFNRYGIFREFPRNEMELELKDALNNPPPRCVQDNATTYMYCNGSFDVLVSSNSNVTGSLAWIPDYANYPGLEKIVHFCDGRGCDGNRNHNADIDNTQNRLCNRRATLDVILANHDFYGSGTPPRQGMDTTPTFTIVHPDFQKGSVVTKKPADDDLPTTTRFPGYDFTAVGMTTKQNQDQPPRPIVKASTKIVLVLDESGSMGDNNKINNLKSAAGQFVDLTDSSIEIAIVSFASSSRVRSQFRAGNEDGKSQLKTALLEINANGGTCIQDGLNDALELLSASGHRGGEIILMTDGMNNCGGDYIELTKDGIKAQGATVHTCAITASADADLKKLADMSNHGKSYVITNGGDITQFLEQIQALLREAAQDSSLERVTLVNDIVDITVNKVNDVPIFLDMGLGKQNLITAMYEKRQVSSMTGELIFKNETNVPCREEADYGKLNCELTFKPKTGLWTLRMRPVFVTPSEAPTKVTVTASATVNTAETNTFSVVGTILKPTIVLGGKTENFWEKEGVLDHSQAFVATVSFGRFAVLGAKVTAVITYQDGTKWRQILSDDGEAYEKGQGADLYENDGVYSALFNKFDMMPGRYSVSLEVASEDGKTFYTRDVLLGIPKSSKYMQQTAIFRNYVTFKRVLSIGMFEVTNPTREMPVMPHDDDVAIRALSGHQVQMRRTSRDADEETQSISLPRPGRVAKLNLLHSSFNDEVAHFTFTFYAVGKNGLTGGFPSYYLLNVSTNIYNVEGRGEEIEVSPLVDRKLRFAYFKREGEESDEPGVPVMINARLPMSEWRSAAKIYFSASAYNYDPETEEWMAGAHSNIVLSGIEQNAEGVCSSDGTGRCSTSPVRQMPFFLRNKSSRN